MNELLKQLQPWHLLTGLLVLTLGYLGRVIGWRIVAHLVRLNDNIEGLPRTVAKTDILWDKHADLPMMKELEKRLERKEVLTQKIG